MNRKQFLVALLVALVAGLFLRLMTFQPAAPTGTGLPAPDFALPLAPSGPPTRISDMKGKVVLLDFWATWCAPCRQSIPELAKLYAKYRDRGLVVIGIAVDEVETQKNIPLAEKALGINYPVVLAETVPGIRDQYSSNSLPTLYIIDRKGIGRLRLEGYDPQGDLDGMLQKYLDEPAE